MVKKEETKGIEQLVIENNTTARITYELARQLESYLPIESVDQLTEKLDEVVVEEHRLPVKIFAPHISNDLFPIKNAEDLVRKLTTGVRTALALGRSPSFEVKNPAVNSILASTRQEQPGVRSGIPVVFAGVGSPLNQPGKGGAFMKRSTHISVDI